jgi:hypothetical protein
MGASNVYGTLTTELQSLFFFWLCSNQQTVNL